MSLGGVGFYSLTTTVAPGAGTKIGAYEVMVQGSKVYYQGVVVGYIDSLGNFTPVDATKPLPVAMSSALLPLKFDYIKATYPNQTTEVYTYRDGGATGAIAATVQVTFTDSSKNLIDEVIRY